MGGIVVVRELIKFSLTTELKRSWKEPLFPAGPGGPLIRPEVSRKLASFTKRLNFHKGHSEHLNAGASSSGPAGQGREQG